MPSYLTVYPDADPESKTVDGRMYYSGNNDWATTHDALTGVGVQDSAASGNTCLVGKNAGGDFNIQRPAFFFDTSSLGADSTITAAVFSLWVIDTYEGDNDGDDWVNVVQPTKASFAGYVASPESLTSLATADYDLVGAVSNPTEGSTRKDLTAGITEGAYNDWTLDAIGRGWIYQTAITGLGMREGHDALNSAYAGAAGTWNSIDTYFAEQGGAGTTQDPKLYITYTPAVTGASLLMQLATA